MADEPEEEVGYVPPSEECDNQIDQSWDPPTSGEDDDDE